MFANRPDVQQGMAEVYKESAKLDGMPVFQTTVMGAEGTAPVDRSDQPQGGQAQQQSDKPSVSSAVGNALGGRFGLGRKKVKISLSGCTCIRKSWRSCRSNACCATMRSTNDSIWVLALALGIELGAVCRLRWVSACASAGMSIRAETVTMSLCIGCMVLRCGDLALSAQWF